MNVLDIQPDVPLGHIARAGEVGRTTPFAERAEGSFEAAMENVEKLSQKLVASAFLVPMLDRLQDDPLRSDLMHGGFAENSFQSLLNTRIADAVAERMQTSATQSIRDRIGEWLKRQPDERIREIGFMRIDTVG